MITSKHVLEFLSIKRRKTDKDTTIINSVMYEYWEFRVIYEVASAILCFILVWFMIKPYSFTRESRYVGLPLAFGLLGSSYLFSAVTYAQPSFFPEVVLWFQLVARTFAFVFLAATYYFSKEPSKPSKLLLKITLSAIVVVVIALFLFVFFTPKFDFQNYRTASTYVRIFIMICLTYITIHVLRRHMQKPEPTTLLIPLGYILLGISQYSLLIWAADQSMFAFWGALVLRGGGLAIFLFVAYLTFYRSHKKGTK